MALLSLVGFWCEGHPVVKQAQILREQLLIVKRGLQRPTSFGVPGVTILFWPELPGEFVLAAIPNNIKNLHM